LQSYIKTPSEIAYIRHAGRILGQVFSKVKEAVIPGVSGDEINRLCGDLISERGSSPAFKGYRGFPANICVSINEVVIHGIPDQKKFSEGDVISIDIGVVYEGYFADASRTFFIPPIADEYSDMIQATRECLSRATSKAIDGNRLTDLSWAIQSYGEGCGFSVVRQYGGHGVGRALHEEPHIFNYGDPGKGPILKKGMVLAIEPILTTGSGRVQVQEDGWSVVTSDNRPAAHFEDTILITDAAAEILTMEGEPNGEPG